MSMKIVPFDGGPDCSFTFPEGSRPAIAASLCQEAMAAHARMSRAGNPEARRREKALRNLLAAAMHRLVADDVELDELAGAQSLKGRS